MSLLKEKSVFFTVDRKFTIAESFVSSSITLSLVADKLQLHKRKEEFIYFLQH